MLQCDGECVRVCVNGDGVVVGVVVVGVAVDDVWCRCCWFEWYWLVVFVMVLLL